jgi:heptosyltransferase-2
MQRILLIRFSSLGDMVLLSALIEALHHEHHGAEVWLATKGSYGSLYHHDPRVHRVVELTDAPDALDALLEELEGVRFDLVLDAHSSLRSRLMCLKLKGPSRVRRIAKDSAARTLFVRTGVRTAALGRHIVERYVGLLEGCERQVQTAVYPAKAHRRFERSRLAGQVLAVAPGARHEPKRWPADRFARVAALHQARTGCTVLVLGGPGEEASCHAVAAALEPSRTIVGVGDQDLSAVAAQLERCALLLCNDSGLMHLAEAVGTPVTALFGPTSRELGYFPWHPRSRVVEHDLSCRPCSRFGARPCHLEDNVCLTRSTVDLVYGVLKSQWAEVLPLVVNERLGTGPSPSIPGTRPVRRPEFVPLPVVGEQLASH